MEEKPPFERVQTIGLARSSRRNVVVRVLQDYRGQQRTGGALEREALGENQRLASVAGGAGQRRAQKIVGVLQQRGRDHEGRAMVGGQEHVLGQERVPPPTHGPGRQAVGQGRPAVERQLQGQIQLVSGPEGPHGPHQHPSIILWTHRRCAWRPRPPSPPPSVIYLSTLYTSPSIRRCTTSTFVKSGSRVT